MNLYSLSIRSALAGLLSVAAANAFAAPAEISADRIREDVRVLSSDAFEGRGPGEPAESKTLNYLTAQFKAAGLEPGAPGGGWLQDVLMMRFDRAPLAKVTVNTPRGPRSLTVGQEVTLASHAVGHGHIENAPLVFVGYGIKLDGWNDFEGADLRGKVAVLLGNDPDLEAPQGSPVAGRFGGPALVYEGRLGVKVGAAMAAGAVGVLVIHEDKAMSWPWRQAQNSDRLPSMSLVPEAAAPPNSFNGLLRKDVAEKLLAVSGHSLSSLKAVARKPGFKAIQLKLSVSADFDVSARGVVSHNVVARLAGRLRRDEVVLYGAHWDANGKGAPDRGGDDFRNGAVDNATGTAELLEVARDFARSAPHQRTAVFVAYTAEEKGLLGSDFYAAHPHDPLEKTVAVINLDPHVMLGRASNLELVGPGQTDLEDDLIAASRAEGLRVQPEPFPEAGWYFRSDHYSFSKRGVPSLSFRIGRDLVSGGLAAGMTRSADYNMNRYHQTKDEFDPKWSFDGAAQEASVALRVGLKLADSDRWPTWREGSAFSVIRNRTAASRRATSPEETSGGPAAADVDERAIRKLRSDNNDAIAAHDLARVMSIAADDYALVGGNDGIHHSKADIAGYWAKDFADPTDGGCVRTPRQIEVGSSGGVTRAAEIGIWECLTLQKQGKMTLFGRYLAHWSQRSGEWRVVSDNYVTLGCRGETCETRP